MTSYVNDPLSFIMMEMKLMIRKNYHIVEYLLVELVVSLNLIQGIRIMLIFIATASVNVML